MSDIEGHDQWQPLDQARSTLAAARDKWQAPDTFAQADADYRSADTSLYLGQVNGAEQFTARSVQAWGDRDRRPAASARILLATIHVRAGEPRGPQLAHNAITAATKLSSDRVRNRLLPLADELDARRGGDYQELAQMTSVNPFRWTPLPVRHAALIASSGSDSAAEGAGTDSGELQGKTQEPRLHERRGADRSKPDSGEIENQSDDKQDGGGDSEHDGLSNRPGDVLRNTRRNENASLIHVRTKPNASHVESASPQQGVLGCIRATRDHEEPADGKHEPTGTDHRAVTRSEARRRRRIDGHPISPPPEPTTLVT